MATNQPTNQPTDGRTLSRIELLSQLKSCVGDKDNSGEIIYEEMEIKIQVMEKDKASLEEEIEDALADFRKADEQTASIKKTSISLAQNITNIESLLNSKDQFSEVLESFQATTSGKVC